MTPITVPYVPNEDPKVELAEIALVIEENLTSDSPEVKSAFGGDLQQVTDMLVVYMAGMQHSLTRQFDVIDYRRTSADFENLAARIPPEFVVTDGNFLKPIVARTVYALRWYLRSDDDNLVAIENYRCFMSYGHIKALEAVKHELQSLFPLGSW
jgi:hypothetical protein